MPLILSILTVLIGLLRPYDWLTKHSPYDSITEKTAMSLNKAIRVVKRDQRELREAQPEALENEAKTERQARRLMLQTVTSWIEEQRAFKKQLTQNWAFVKEQAD